jgi:hypothetical protein
MMHLPVQVPLITDIWLGVPLLLKVKGPSAISLKRRMIVKATQMLCWRTCLVCHERGIKGCVEGEVALSNQGEETVEVDI